jgi:hypothetical protein
VSSLTIHQGAVCTLNGGPNPLDSGNEPIRMPFDAIVIAIHAFHTVPMMHAFRITTGIDLDFTHRHRP